MDDMLKEALQIVKAQASVRPMTEEEIVTMVRGLAAGLSTMSLDTVEKPAEPAEPVVLMAPQKSIKEKSITCLECGKVFKVLTQKHLSLHGLTPEEYKEKWGFKKNSPLVCKELQRSRRTKMKEMKLWEKRVKVNTGM